MSDNRKYKVGITVKEPWSPNISYEQLDMTLNAIENGGDGCAYVAIQPNLGIRPGTDPTVWVKASERGQSIYDYCVEYGLFVGTEEEFAQTYTNAVNGANTAARDANETNLRVTEAENDRVLAENARVSAENERVLAENARAGAESDRVVAENARAGAESDRVLAENGRVLAESERVQSEQGRVTAEERRVDAESDRVAEWGLLAQDVATAIGLADAATTRANSAATQSEELNEHPMRISTETYTWERWDSTANRYVDTGIKATFRDRGAYNEQTSYAQLDVVQVVDYGSFYSRINNNIGNDPVTDTTNWAPIASGVYAKAQGDYAKTQGDYAKQQGDAFGSIIADNVTTDDPTKALSAKQGVVLDEKISQLGEEIDKFEQSVNGDPGYKSGQVNNNTGEYSEGTGTRVITILPFNADVKIVCENGIKVAAYYQYVSDKSPFSDYISPSDFTYTADVVTEVTIPLNTSYPNTYVVFRKTDSSASLTTQEVIDNVTIDLSGTTDSRISKLETDVLTKVDKVAGKGLSSNDYTDLDKNAVDSLFTDTYIDVTASETQNNHYIDYEGVVQSTTISWKVSKFDVRGSSKVKVSGFNHHTTTASACYPLMAELGTDGTTVLAVHETGSDQRYTDEEFTLNAATAYILVGDKGTYSPAAKKQVQVLDIYTKTEADEIIGDLDDLQTSDKSNLVAAINEAAQSGGGGGGDVSSCVRKMLIKTIYVGDNLLGSTVGSGAGWTYNNGSYTHTSGNTAPLVFALATTSGKKYIAKISVSSTSGFIEESLLVSIGDGKLCDLYNGSANFVVGLVSDGGYLKITPGSAYTGTISSVELMEINEGEVGTAMTISLDNVSAGTDFNNITGWYNAAIGGNDALQANINGSRNIAIGVHSLMALKSGERNIGIGTFSMKNMVYGLRNIAIGADSMMYVTGAEDNVAIGKATFDNASGGDNPKQNVAIGSRAMQTNQDNAQKNVAIGYDAGRSAQDCNVCVGWRAGYNATSNNVYVGHNAGFHDSGANNVYIGYNTYYGTATRSNNVFIGYDTHPTNQDSVQNSIAIGAGVVINESNTCKIGNSSVATFILGNKKLVFNNDNTVSWEAVS